MVIGEIAHVEGLHLEICGERLGMREAEIAEHGIQWKQAGQTGWEKPERAKCRTEFAAVISTTASPWPATSPSSSSSAKAIAIDELDCPKPLS